MTESPSDRKWKPYSYHTKKKTPYDYYPTTQPKDKSNGYPSPWEKGDWPYTRPHTKKSELDRLQRIRLNQGGLPLNWLKTFGYSYNGLKNLLIMLNLPIPKERNKKRQWPKGYPPEKNPYIPKHPHHKEWEWGHEE